MVSIYQHDNHNRIRIDTNTAIDTAAHRHSRWHSDSQSQGVAALVIRKPDSALLLQSCTWSRCPGAMRCRRNIHQVPYGMASIG